MKKQLTKIGNSYGLILTRETLGLLGIDPEEGVNVCVIGTLLLVGSHKGGNRASLKALRAMIEDQFDE